MRRGSLQTVLALRRHREDAEERVLQAIQREMRDAARERRRIDGEIVAIGAARVAEARSYLYGADYHREGALYCKLLAMQLEVGSQIEKLKEKQARQMDRYLSARQEREVISDLEEKRVRAMKAEAESRETKRIEDLFLARFGRR